MYVMSNYERIIEIICSMKGIDKEELFKILEDREFKYLLFLLLKRYKCDDINKISKDFSINSRRTVNYNVKKAQEKFFKQRI
ncbi:ribose-5-phosphate isomerase [Clostridium bovifaecis]|uniref:Ribose-5-phosphate isomerase n=1 Tax=Clostridium bovifaecis TaxID=2184719 RepID=A0A6I6ENU9_9CLOT|nr:ribose-5-phosphate isomerase [Clostridium bovifaecis]